jgi:hypothetical protein
LGVRIKSIVGNKLMPIMDSSANRANCGNNFLLFASPLCLPDKPETREREHDEHRPQPKAQPATA